MEHSITVGTKGKMTKEVEQHDTASALGSGLAEVFATPAMIAFMEETAYTSIEPLLPEGYSSVGIEINVKHSKASLPGTTVECSSEVTKVEGKKIFFTITARDTKDIIGTAEHIRYIIHSEKFMEGLREKA